MMKRYEKKRQSLPRARSLRVFARSVASLLANVTVLIEPDCWRLRLRVLLGWPDLGLRLRVRWPLSPQVAEDLRTLPVRMVYEETPEEDAVQCFQQWGSMPRRVEDYTYVICCCRHPLRRRCWAPTSATRRWSSSLMNF